MEDRIVELLINGGIAGVVLLWFMWRLEKRLDHLARTNQLLALAIARVLERDGHTEGASAITSELTRHLNEE